MDAEKLAYWAVRLEEELIKHRHDAEVVASLMEYDELMNAIGKAKEMMVSEPVRLPALTYYFFETNLRDFKALTTALSSFTLVLEGLELPGTCGK